ncbi:MAG TPA: DMT family transporter [Alphaproteobacteria bacterium]
MAGGRIGAGPLAALRRAVTSPYALLVLAALFWGGNWVAGRGLRDDVPPVALAFWRWVVAAVVFLPFTLPAVIRHRHVVRREWLRLLVFALIGVTAFNVMTYIGLSGTPAINGALINSAAPIFTFVTVWLAFGERVTARQIVGVALSLVGVAVIVARGDLAALVRLEIRRADLWIMAAVYLWAIYTIMLRRWPSSLPPTTFLAVIIIIGMAFLVPLYLWELSSGRTLEIHAGSIGGIVYLGLFASLGAYICWNRGVQVVGPARGSLFQHLIPVFTAMFAVLLIGESVELFHLVGIVLILAGIYLATWSGRPGGAPAPAPARE